MVDNPPAKKYIVAVDQATSTLVEVAQALSTAMGPGPVEVLEGAAAEERLLTDASVTALQLDLQFDTEEATVAGFDFEWTAQAGFVENAAAVAAEFVAERNLRPVMAMQHSQLLHAYMFAHACRACCTSGQGSTAGSPSQWQDHVCQRASHTLLC